MSMKRKRAALLPRTKCEVINSLERSKIVTEFADKSGIRISTICGVKKTPLETMFTE